jgi:hypothetical protein
VRTTLTLDDDVARRIKAEVRPSGKPFRSVVNDVLRLGFASRQEGGEPAAPFVIEARDLGVLRPGLGLDNVGDLLESVEGPLHR